MNVLFAIFSCNRMLYLKNCIQSVLEFVKTDQCKIMIVDNCTIEKGFNEFIDSLPKNIIVHRFRDRVPNELYRAMNFSIQYCIDCNIKYINFLQDDYQYLYKNESFVDNVIQVFEIYKDIGQVHTNAIWKRKQVGRYNVIKVKKVNYAVLEDKMLTDNGFTRVSIYKKIGLYPNQLISYDQNSTKTFGFGKNRYKNHVNGELWFGNKCKKIGFKRAVSFLPNLGIMFDCSYVRGLNRFGNYFPPINKYYLKPFSESDIRCVKKRNKKNKFTYIENSVLPDGWIPKTYEKHSKVREFSKIE